MAPLCEISSFVISLKIIIFLCLSKWLLATPASFHIISVLLFIINLPFHAIKLRGPFEKFVNSLLRVGTLWRYGDGLFVEVPPLASDALLTTLHPLLENVLQIVDHLEISCLGAPFSWLEKPRNRMGRDLDCMADVLMGFHRSTFSKPNTEFNSDLAPCNFWAFPTTKTGLRGKKFRCD
jgi:hypothetical protein